MDYTSDVNSGCKSTWGPSCGYNSSGIFTSVLFLPWGYSPFRFQVILRKYLLLDSSPALWLLSPLPMRLSYLKFKFVGISKYPQHKGLIPLTFLNYHIFLDFGIVILFFVVISFMLLRCYIYIYKCYLAFLVVFSRWIDPINIVCHISELGSPQNLWFSVSRVFLP